MGFQGMLNSMYRQITFTRITIAFFTFGFVHCLAQAVMHTFLLCVDAQYDTFLTKIVEGAGNFGGNHSYIDGPIYSTREEHTVWMCDNVPHNDGDCEVVMRFDSSIENSLSANLTSITSLDGISAKTIVRASDPESGLVEVTLSRDGKNITTLDQQCVRTLLYVQQELQNEWREDMTLVLFQFWIFGMGVFAMIFGSVGHVWAFFFARFLLTGWSAYALWRTKHWRLVFLQLTGSSGGGRPGFGSTCNFDLFSEYFRLRGLIEIPDLILNVSALGVALYLSLSLINAYELQSVSRVGPPNGVVKIYKYYMAVQACLQLELFVLATAMGLWVDQLFNSYIRILSAHTPAYVGLVVTSSVLLVPWIAMGWYSIRREIRWMVLAFWGTGALFVVEWSVMFYSDVYRWTFYTWPILACFTVASMLLILIIMGLSVVCRVKFGQGLKEYFQAEAALSKMHFAPEVFDNNVDKAVSTHYTCTDVESMSTYLPLIPA